MQLSQVDRRRFERFAVLPMYTEIALRKADQQEFGLLGHAYDISEGGVRFELDVPIEPGTAVAAQIMLPGLTGGVGGESVDGPGRAVFVQGNVVWCTVDVDEPGPVQMAMAITRFCREGDRERLMRRLSRRASAFRRVA